MIRDHCPVGVRLEIEVSCFDSRDTVSRGISGTLKPGFFSTDGIAIKNIENSAYYHEQHYRDVDHHLAFLLTLSVQHSAHSLSIPLLETIHSMDSCRL